MTTPTTTRRAPYQVGDHVAALYLDPRHGTCLARNARVVAIAHTDERAAYPWTITYQLGPDQTRQTRVNDAGVDANRYVEPSTSVLTIDEAHTENGQAATALAASLRRARVPGPLASTTGGANVAVVITWPSGNDRIVAAVNVWNGAPTYDIAAYPDRAHEVPDHEETVHGHDDATAAIIRLHTVGAA